MTLPRAVDHTHPAAADLVEDFVIPKAPILIGQIHFREKCVQGLGVAVIRIEAGFEETTDTKSAGNVRGGIALGARPWVIDHIRHRIGKSWGESFHSPAGGSAASTPQR